MDFINAATYLECGSLPSLWAGEACFAQLERPATRDVLQKGTDTLLY